MSRQLTKEAEIRAKQFHTKVIFEHNQNLKGTPWLGVRPSLGGMES